jgi:chromosome segregation ATPase
LSSAALEKPQHRDLKATVAAWIAGANKRIVRGAKSIRVNVSERVADANEQLRQVRQAWVEAELGYTENCLELATLTTKNKLLKGEIRQLRAQLSRLGVVLIDEDDK